MSNKKLPATYSLPTHKSSTYGLRVISLRALSPQGFSLQVYFSRAPSLPLPFPQVLSLRATLHVFFSTGCFSTGSRVPLLLSYHSLTISLIASSFSSGSPFTGYLLTYGLFPYGFPSPSGPPLIYSHLRVPLLQVSRPTGYSVLSSPTRLTSILVTAFYIPISRDPGKQTK